MNLLPGFRFHPTDSELITYYLRRKVEGLPIPTLGDGAELILNLDLYKHEPWDLQGKSSLMAKSDQEQYFFTPLEKKYVNSMRSNRATEAGYWRATGRDKEVKEKGQIVGLRKTLVFYKGSASMGERTNFVIHEYRLHKEMDPSKGLVVCKVMEKSGVGRRKALNQVPHTDMDDPINMGPGKHCLEPGIMSASELVPTPEETPEVARIDMSLVSAASFSEACDDSELWENIPSLTDLRFNLPTLGDEKNSSEPVGATDTEAATPSGVMGKFDMSSKAQQMQQKQEDASNVGDEFWDKCLTNDVIESLVTKLVGRM